MIKTFVKGLLIGAAKVIPGFSGSLLAMALGVYEPALKIVVNFKEITLKKLLFLIGLGIGIIIGIIIFSMIIKFLIQKLYFPVMLFFIGLIAASVRDLYIEVKNYLLTFKGLILSLISIIGVYSLDCLQFNIFASITNYTYFPLGIIEALTTLIPGISGTSVYMIFDVYDVILSFYTNLFNAVGPLFYFLMGLLIGGYFVAKIVLILLKKYREVVMTIIFGFMTAAITVLFKDALVYNFNIKDIFFGIFLLFSGYKLVNVINHIFNPNA